MATYTLSIPSVGLTAPSSIGSKAQVKESLISGLKNYGKYFKFAAENSKLPVEMLVAFAAVESGVGKNIGPAGHPTRGIMQWNRSFTKSTLENEFKLGRLTPAEKDKLASYGIKFDANGKTREITEADQIKPELNILIGSIIIGMLADSIVDGKKASKSWGTDENGNVRLDRIIAVYNAGAYGDTGKKARTGNYVNAQALANAVNSTTSTYIKKLMGQNGYYHTLLEDLKSEVGPYQA